MLFALEHPVGQVALTSNCQANRGSVSFVKILGMNEVLEEREDDCRKISFEVMLICPQPLSIKAAMLVP